ncbi:coiled-coil domain-containing protein [Vibrio alfacsensis]|uniref:coiled-coil domain-containing protein n=1 Tax=Vibrio alfacsensis TaxID=1074311 RepID=UPI001BED9C99|nr:hypothetical protein [Vibrio alfacsensis]BCN25761.1 hypothetical protein VYA_29530 [Vibrio alfacsensis]
MLHFTLWGMGILIVTFNVMGYDELFNAEPWFEWFPITPFGMLLGFAEFAVLGYTSAIFSNWVHTSFTQKCVTWMIIFSFGMLCFSGVNGYLQSLSTSEIVKATEARKKTENNVEYIATLENDIQNLESNITQLTAQIIPLSEQIESKGLQIKELHEKASARRFKTLVCDEVKDCRDSVTAFVNQAELLEDEVDFLNSTRVHAQAKVIDLEKELSAMKITLRTEQVKDRDTINEYAGTETDYELKKQSYENKVNAILGLFGIKTDTPYDWFIGFVSFIIYPVYLALNMFVNFQSDVNISKREEIKAEKATKKIVKNRHKSIRTRMLKHILQYVMLMNQRNKNHKELQSKPVNKGILRKLIKYFRVWSKRRTKLIPVETIVEKEIEVEVEKLVEIEKLVEVDKEIPVYVDRVIAANNEVPVYVDKIVEVEVPYLVKQPEIIVHERIIPVPDSITGDELQELVNA